MERLPEFEEVISETNSDHRNILLGNGFSIACDNYNLSAKMEYVWHEMECRLILKILCGKSFHFKSRTSQME